MKKLLLLTTAMLLFCISHYGQVDLLPVKKVDLNTGEYFLHKSRHQAKTGLILLGTGIAASAISLAVFPKDYDIFNNENNSSGTKAKASIATVLFLAGGGMIIASIPVFITSIVNRHKARILLNRERVELSPQLKSSQWQMKTGLAINF